MVLVHKLKQMEGLDIEQFNNDEEVSPSPAGTEDEVEEQPKDNEGEKTSVVDETNMRPTSPPRRPLTRSQTGRVPKRRRRDETPPAPAVRKKIVAPRNNPQPVQSTIVTEDIDAQGDKHSTTPSNGTAPNTAAARSDTPLSMTQLTFLDGSSSSISTSMDRRGPRSRAVLPVPVPNLTKKSRGRRVPTKLATGNNGEQQESRLYVCNVESCGKCFHRGEHLKRHIRSIHTHEKPFKCSYPSCDKNFNRHDNLLQHLKVHKAPSSSHSSPDGDKSPSQKPQRSLSPPVPQLPPHQHQSYPQAVYEVSQARMTIFHQQPQFASYSTSYTSTSEPISFATNMAVSSLRTEIPHSPPTRYEVPAHQHYCASFAN